MSEYAIVPKRKLTTTDRMTVLVKSSSGVFKQILDFLDMYEAIGLGMVSTEIRKLVQPYVQQKFHYEPWAPDVWNSLGYIDVTKLIDNKKVNEIGNLAAKAFLYMSGNVQKTLNRDPDVGVGCKIVANISKNTITKTGKRLYDVNCLATLEMGGVKVWAVNFTACVPMEDLEKILGDKGFANSIDYKRVPMRHSEMRLIVKVARCHQACKLSIDKVCCVFCASQLVALGYKDLVVGWNKGRLSWYTFSPLVVYFTDKRQAMWGAETEIAFNNLSRNERLVFLYRLVQQTQTNTPLKRSTNNLLIQNPSKKPNIGTKGTCPKCGFYPATWKDAGYGPFWACPNFKNHK